MKNQGFIGQKPQVNASGNVLIIILIIIALLGGLTVTLTRMGNTVSEVPQEEAQVIATQVLRQAQAMVSGIEALRTKGCSITQFSFDGAAPAPDYINAQAPADNSCALFNLAGAGMAPPQAPLSSNDGSKWFYSSLNAVSGVGPERESGVDCTSRCSDLLMILPMVNLNVCKAINLLAKVTTSFSTTPPQSSTNFQYHGRYSAPNLTAVANNFTIPTQTGIKLKTSTTPITTSALWDKSTGCFEAAGGYTDPAGTSQTGTGKYFFYQVLVER